MADDPNVSAIAGWEQLSVDLSAHPHGLRVVLVLLDATGQPISASDHVLTTRPAAGGDTLLEHTHDSLGGRLESDGTFNGTRWHMVRVLPEDYDDTGDPEASGFDAQSSKPTADEVAGIKALVAEILRRAG